MKKSIKTIIIVITVAIMLVGAYWLGTTQAKTVDAMPNTYIDTSSSDFYENYVDMRQVTDFVAGDDGLQLYLSDGNGYYLER